MTADDRFAYQASDPDEEYGVRSEIITGPVSDWATDFSHLEPEWSADPYPIQDDLRQRCPIAHTERFGGGWLPTRYDDVAAVAYDTEHRSEEHTPELQSRRDLVCRLLLEKKKKQNITR